MDVLLSLLVLPVVLPLLVFGLLLAALGSRGPLIFRQTRVGLDGRNFELLKIRTLKVGTVDRNAGTYAGDPSIERFGYFLRRWRIDELPQIWNIMKGEMSWIGPRPERPELIYGSYDQLPNYCRRHEALPGITGWAQVHRPDAKPDEADLKLPYDLEYIELANLALDLRILLHTFKVMG